MSHAYEPLPAARLLTQAWRERRYLEALPEECRPTTLEQGYALQQCFVNRLGEPVAGWKLGVGSVAARRRAGLSQAVIGQLPASRVFHEGQAVRLPKRSSVVEFEIAFQLACDLAPEDPRPTRDALIANSRMSIEFVHSRFVDRAAVGMPSFIGENVAFEALVLSETAPPDLDVLHSTLRLTQNGVAVSETLNGDEAIDPYQSLDVLMAHARSHDLTLKTGQWVTTGAFARPFDLADGEVELCARFDGGVFRIGITREA